MPGQSDERYEAVTTPGREWVEMYRASLEQEGEPVSLGLVHYRAGREEFEIGCACLRSADPLDRVTGARVLAQLGWGEECFHGEVVDHLLALLQDGDVRVVAEALSGLGHRTAPGIVPSVLLFVDHGDAGVRSGAVSALGRQKVPEAADGLVILSRDEDDDVRNWATFYLGSIIDFDSTEIRDALAARLNEEDAEIRGEALIGLARRGDIRGYAPLAEELEGEFHGSWCLEAAELTADRRLVPQLERLRASVDARDREKFAADFDRAMAACLGESPPHQSPES